MNGLSAASTYLGDKPHDLGELLGIEAGTAHQTAVDTALRDELPAVGGGNALSPLDRHFDQTG